MGSGSDQEDVPDEGRADLGLRDEAHLAQQLLQVRPVDSENLKRSERRDGMRGRGCGRLAPKQEA